MSTEQNPPRWVGLLTVLLVKGLDESHESGQDIIWSSGNNEARSKQTERNSFIDRNRDLKWKTRPTSVVKSTVFHCFTRSSLFLKLKTGHGCVKLSANRGDEPCD
jgi:hypothetical protein